MPVITGTAAPDPLGPGTGPHEGPLVDREAVRFLFGEVSVVVQMLLQDCRDRGPLGVRHLPPGQTADDVMAFFRPGEGWARTRKHKDCGENSRSMYR
jgi:hypothetical protein